MTKHNTITQNLYGALCKQSSAKGVWKLKIDKKNIKNDDHNTYIQRLLQCTNVVILIL